MPRCGRLRRVFIAVSVGPDSLQRNGPATRILRSRRLNTAPTVNDRLGCCCRGWRKIKVGCRQKPLPRRKGFLPARVGGNQVFTVPSCNCDSHSPCAWGETAAEYRIFCERQAGVLLLWMDLNKGAQGNPGGRGAKLVQSPSSTAQPTLSDIGITKRQSSEYQQLANIPEDEIDARIEEQKAEGKPPTISATLKPHVSHHPASDWGGDSLQRNAHGTPS